MTYQRPQIHSWNSHLLLLERIMPRLQPGPILELGMGDGSTPFFDAWASDESRVVSAENNVMYFKTAQEYCVSPFHKAMLVDDWRKFMIEVLTQSASRGQRLELAFVDHAPGERRADDIKMLSGFAHYIVVHDTEAACYNYEPVLSNFAYRYDHKEHPTWTTVVSNHNDLKWLRE